MKIKYVLVLFSVIFLNNIVFAAGDHDLKGMYPFMGFIYYPDESVVDTSGNRFLRGAVLILKDWLVTSAVQIGDSDVGFPRKTLLARLGAVTIDSKFTLNEDEDEQEREVVKIVRPYNHSATQWWRTDITLMQTLLPFNLTAAVSVAPTESNSDKSEKPCFTLTFAKRQGNNTEDRVLTKSYMDLLTPSIENCGSHYFETTMLCAVDSEEKKDVPEDTSISACQVFKGGPLVCSGLVVALQTYIDSCRAPHLFQSITPWLHFIDCATNNKCDQVECADLCTITNKDSPVTLESSTLALQDLSSSPDTTINVTITETTQETTFEETSEFTTILETTMTTEPNTHTTTKETTVVTHETMTYEIVQTSVVQVIQEKVSKPTTILKPVAIVSQRPLPKGTTKQVVKQVSAKISTSQNPWPKERISTDRTTEDDDCERNLTLEAQRNAKDYWIKHSSPSRASSVPLKILYLFETVSCVIVLTYLF